MANTGISGLANDFWARVCPVSIQIGYQLSIALRVDRDVIADEGRVLSCDMRYFLTSLAPEQITAAQLLATIRAHWQIENSLFFLNDRWWDEDRH